MDAHWYPKTFRRNQTDYLQFVATLNSGHQNMVPLFRKALERKGADGSLRSEPERAVGILDVALFAPDNDCELFSDDSLYKTAPLQNSENAWEIGLASTGTPIFDFTYLIGYPSLGVDDR